MRVLFDLIVSCTMNSAFTSIDLKIWELVFLAENSTSHTVLPKEHSNSAFPSRGQWTKKVVMLITYIRSCEKNDFKEKNSINFPGNMIQDEPYQKQNLSYVNITLKTFP